MTAREVYRLPWRLRFRRFWAFYMDATLALLQAWVFECVCIRGEKIEKFTPRERRPEDSAREDEAAAAEAAVKPAYSYVNDIVPVAQKASVARKQAADAQAAAADKDKPKDAKP